jgi:hypothetical protein
MNNNPLSDRINNLSTSQTLAMAALARELKAQGKDIISLSLFNLFSSRWVPRIERSHLQKI